MTVFIVGAACLIAVAVWMLRSTWRSAPTPGLERPAHLGILGEQLAALDREHAAGQLDDEQHRLARSELQRRVLDESAAPDADIRRTGSSRTVIGVGLAVPILAVALYAAIGNPAALTPQPVAAAAANGEVTPEALNAMLANLAQRLEKSSGNPATDLQGWTMLARSYAALQRFDDADRAFVRALALAPHDAPLLADRADVLAMLQGQRTAGEPERLALEALRIEPKNVKALALVGAAAFERKDFGAARGYWQKARQLTPDGSEFAAGLDRSIAELGGPAGDASTASASARAGDRPVAVATDAPASAPGPAARITGRVSLSPALASKVAPTDTVFVFARAAEGPRMPLAIVRRTVADLPFDFTLDDGMAMSPQMKLSGFERVVVGARISRSGNAMPQPGDLRGESPATETKVDGLKLVIDGVQP